MCVKNLTIRFPEQTLLENVSFEITTGDCVGIYGPPESGKTSLLLALCGVKAFYDGTITAFGEAVDSRREKYKQQIGLVTQQCSLFAEMTVRENIAFIGTIHGCQMHSPACREQYDSLITALQLDDYLHKRVSSLSRGLQKRAALACALLHQPKLLLLDELTAQIDPASSVLLLNTVQAYRQNGGTCLATIGDLQAIEHFNRIGMIEEQTLTIYPQAKLREKLEQPGVLPALRTCKEKDRDDKLCHHTQKTAGMGR